MILHVLWQSAESPGRLGGQSSARGRAERGARCQHVSRPHLGWRAQLVQLQRKWSQSDKPEDAAVCFSEVLSLRCLLKRKKNLPKKGQSQIGVVQYDSEADPILVSEFPPSHSRRPLLTGNMAMPRFQAGFARRFQCNFGMGS